MINLKSDTILLVLQIAQPLSVIFLSYLLYVRSFHESSSEVERLMNMRIEEVQAKGDEGRINPFKIIVTNSDNKLHNIKRLIDPREEFKGNFQMSVQSKGLEEEEIDEKLKEMKSSLGYLTLYDVEERIFVIRLENLSKDEFFTEMQEILKALSNGGTYKGVIDV
jgi:hypothetical protein